MHRKKKRFASVFELLAAHLLMAIITIITVAGCLLLDALSLPLQRQTIWGLVGMVFTAFILYITLQNTRNLARGLVVVTLIIAFSHVGTYLAVAPYL